MSDTNLTNARIQLKYDTEANWKENAPTFIPRAGEIIIYSPDTNHSTPRFKVGDGENYLITLPFSNDELIMKNGNSDYWLNNLDYTPKAGEIVIINANNAGEVASIKIGDGETPFENLPEFSVNNASNSITAQKLVNELGTAYNIEPNNLIYFSNGIPEASDIYVWKTVPVTAEFTDTKYTAATTNKEGLMSAEDKIALDNLKNKAVLNTQTASSSQFGVIKLGSNLTELNGVVSVPIATTTSAGAMSAADKIKLNGLENIQADWNATSGAAAILNKPTIPSTAEEVGAIPNTTKVATLGEDGFILSSQLPSYVDEIIEVENSSSFPAVGESGKIYVTIEDRKTYRWSGSEYVEISASLTLGDTKSTAYRGDLGAIAYTHATATSGAAAHEIGFYKVRTNAEGHVIGAEKVIKADITSLGIPAQDTTYSIFNTSDNGLVPASSGKQNEYLAADGSWKTISAPEINYPVTSVNGQTGEVQLTAADVNALPSDTKLFSGSYNDLDDKPPIPQAITIDTALSTTSTNPVQNNVINTALGNKVDKVSGKGLSTNDFTTAYKNKLDNLDTNLNNKQNTITGAATTITSSNLTKNRALISDSSGKISVSSITDTKLGYLSGVTSDIQTQLNNKINKDDDDDISSIVNNSSVLSALGASGVDAGQYAAYTTSYGNYTNYIYMPYFTVDEYGRITKASYNLILAPYATISEKTNAWNGTKGSANQPIYFDSYGRAQTCNTIPDTSNFLTSDNLTGYALISQLDNLEAKIPLKVSELTNDSGYITSSALNGYIKTVQIGSTSFTTSGTTASISKTNARAALGIYTSTSADMNSISGTSGDILIVTDA